MCDLPANIRHRSVLHLKCFQLWIVWIECEAPSHVVHHESFETCMYTITVDFDWDSWARVMKCPRRFQRFYYNGLWHRVYHYYYRHRLFLHMQIFNITNQYEINSPKRKEKNASIVRINCINFRYRERVKNKEYLPPPLFCGYGCDDGVITSSSQYAKQIKMFKLIKIQ